MKSANTAALLVITHEVEECYSYGFKKSIDYRVSAISHQ